MNKSFIQAITPPESISGGFSLQAMVLNASNEAWISSGPNPVNLAYHWLDEDWNMVVFDGVRTPLPQGGIPPGGTAKITAQIAPPPNPGKHRLFLNLVREGVGWLEIDEGFRPQILDINIYKFRYLIIGGGFRTGSTLLYNLMGVYLECADMGVRVGLVDPDDVDKLPEWYNLNKNKLLVAKSHMIAASTFFSFKNPSAWADLLNSNDAKAIMSIRDESEVKISIARKFNIPMSSVEDSLYLKANSFFIPIWEEKGAVSVFYNNLVKDGILTLKYICSRLSIPFKLDAAQYAASITSLENHIQIMGKVQEGAWDPLTLLHWNHISQQNT